MLNTRFSHALVFSVFGLGLAACGGSSDDPAETPEPAGKYVGTWDSSCAAEGRISANGSVTLNKSGPTTLTGSSVLRLYNNTSCAGSPSSEQAFPASLTVDGAGTASGRTVDKVTSTAYGETDKDIYLVEGNRLFESPENSPKDAQGYPTTLDMASAAIKR